MVTVIYVRKLFAGGMAVFPFILIRKSDRQNKVLLHHEKIHIRQQLELLVLPFYFLYGIFYVINLFKYRNHSQAYRNIPFEKEAFEHETDFSYLNKRKGYRFLQFIG